MSAEAIPAAVDTPKAEPGTATGAPPSNLLARIFGALVGSHLGGSAIGLVFWIIAARTLTPHEVGVGAALIAAMNLLAMVGLFGVGTLMLERLKFVSDGDRHAWHSTGLGAAALGGAAVAAVWLGLCSVAHLPGTLGNLSLETALLVVAATAAATLCAAFDQAAIGLGTGSIQLTRNLTAAVLRIVALCAAVALDLPGGEVIIIAWLFGLLGSLVIGLFQQRLQRSPVPFRRRWTLVRENWSVALGHHGLTLAVASGTLLLPVVVASLMSAQQTAFFNQARLLSDAALAIPYFLTMALLATVTDINSFRRAARRTMVAGTAFAVVTVAVAALIGGQVLMVFGPDYAAASRPLLLLLLCAGPLLVVKDHFSVLRRVQGRRNAGAVAIAVWTVTELSGAVLGGITGGVTGLCIGWLGGSALCALVAAPVLLRAISEGNRAVPVPADTASAADKSLTQFWNTYTESPGAALFVARNPLECWRALRALRELPTVRVRRTSPGPGGREVRSTARGRGPLGMPTRWWGTAALAVPGEASQYLEGPSAQTLRRKIRAATRQGLSCRAPSPAERTALLDRANARERVHHDHRYRVTAPRNDDLLDHELWLVTEDATGEPLLLTVIPVDGPFATLRYFRTLGSGETHSLSRYLATHAVVEELSKRGVRWLLDPAPPGVQKNGIRHFQRMVGFRYVRLMYG